MDNKAVSEAIYRDIDNGVYNNFTYLKNRLRHLANKLVSSTYVINSDGLSEGEMATLRGNDYIT